MQSTAHRRSQRGFSLIEAMISLAILTVALLGIAQLQLFSSAQNGIGRRAATAAAIAREFVETAQRWDFDDPRLVNARGCGVELDVNFPLTEAGLGFEQAPEFAADFTATKSTVSGASNEGAIQDGLEDADRPFLGASLALVSGEGSERYQLLWSVRDLDPSNLAATTGCRAKQLSIAVRYPVGKDRYRTVVTTLFKYDPSLIAHGGIAEII